MQFRKPMRCPACLSPMTALDTKEERHADSSGHGAYICINKGCKRLDGEVVVYRRMTRGMDERRAMLAQATKTTNAAALAQFRIQTERLNEITIWLRENRPDLLDGRFNDQVDIMLHLLKVEKAGGKQ